VSDTLTYREAWIKMGISKRTFYRLKAEGRFDRLMAPLPHRLSRKRVEEFINGRDVNPLRRAS
jgi:hypothetical protein